MSRSYKHNTWEKIESAEWRRKEKKISNRKVRSTDEDEVYSSPAWYKKVYNSYNICDYKCRTDFYDFCNWEWVQKLDLSDEDLYALWRRKYGTK